VQTRNAKRRKKIRKRKWCASEIRVKDDLRMQLFVKAAFINQAFSLQVRLYVKPHL